MLHKYRYDITFIVVICLYVVYVVLFPLKTVFMTYNVASLDTHVDMYPVYNQKIVVLTSVK